MIKKLLRRVGKVAAALVLTLGAFAAYVAVTGIPRYAPPQIPDLHVAVTPERVARGKLLSSMLCADCHEDQATQKLTGKHLEEMPKEFGQIYSRNITKDPDHGIGRWTDGELAVFLRTGLRRNGEYVPPYMVKLPHLSDEDLASVIAYLRSDDPKVAAAPVDPPGFTQPGFVAKLLTHTVMKPLPYPSAPIVAPPRTDRVAYGRYVAFTFDCWTCHSADFKTMNPMEPEKTPGYFGGGNVMTDARSARILTANLTPDDETGIGRWSEADFVRAVKQGFRPDGHVLRSPMTPRSALSDDDVKAIYAYLRTVPKIHNAVDRDFPAAPEAGDSGTRLFASYGCAACHGDHGVGRGGFADLRRANEHFATDAELRDWIDRAPELRPGTQMPAWKGIIREADYPALLAHVRKLASAGRTASN